MEYDAMLTGTLLIDVSEEITALRFKAIQE
jgi:hypothetical protein